MDRALYSVRCYVNILDYVILVVHITDKGDAISSFVPVSMDPPCFIVHVNWYHIYVITYMYLHAANVTFGITCCVFKLKDANIAVGNCDIYFPEIFSTRYIGCKSYNQNHLFVSHRPCASLLRTQDNFIKAVRIFLCVSDLPLALNFHSSVK